MIFNILVCVRAFFFGWFGGLGAHSDMEKSNQDVSGYGEGIKHGEAKGEEKKTI